MLECALGTSGPTSEIQTPLATARGNQGQCWNALWEPLGHQLRYPDSPCTRSGESRAMLECFWELWATAPISRLSLQPPGELKPMLECALGTSRPPTLISSLPLQLLGGSRPMLECAVETSWAPTPISRLPLEPLGEIKVTRHH